MAQGGFMMGGPPKGKTFLKVDAALTEKPLVCEKRRIRFINKWVAEGKKMMGSWRECLGK